MNSFINITIRVAAAQAQAQLRAIQTQTAQMTGGLTSLGSQIQWIGRQLEYNFTLPLLLAGGAAFKFAMDNEKAMVRVTKVYGDATHGADFYRNEIASLQKAFEALSNEFGVNQAATINIAADWAAAGASGLALAKAVKLTMQTMILGEMDATAATQALISIQAQYGFGIEDLAKVIATLNMVENQTAISLAGLIDGFQRSAGVARATGVDVRHLAAYLAALTPAAGSAAQAGNALKTIFSRLVAPTKDTADVLALMGVNMQDVSWQSSTMVDKLALLADKFAGLSDAQKNVVSSVIASRWQVNRFDILMKEINSDTGYYAQALNSTASAQANFTQMQRELNTVLTSSPQRLQVMWTMLQNAMADIIQPLIPLILYLAQTIAALAQWFSNLNPAIQRMALMFLVLLAGIGPIVRYFGALLVLLRIVATAFGWLWAPISAAIGLLGRLGSAILGFFTGGLVTMLRGVGVAIAAAITGPWGIAIAIVTTLVVVFWKYIVQAFHGIVAGIQAGWNALPASIQNAMMAVVRTVAAAVKVVREWLSYLNPWARHSPSLVDDVASGVAEIIRQYKLLTNADVIFGQAGVAVQAFAQDMYDARQMADKMQWDQVLASITQYAPQLTAPFNEMMAVLISLRSQMTALNAAFPMEQFKAIDDAIFNNKQQVKALQLQYMNLEDALGPLDKLQGKIDAINGQMELISGNKADLRNAGAGSDILNQYDEQLKALDAQKKAIADQVKPLQDMADQLAALERAGQKMQHEEDLQFDPIRRQADELAQAISQVEAALNSMSQAASAAGGGLGGAGKNFQDAAGGNFPDPGGDAQIGRQGGVADQSAMIDDFTKSLAAETAKMFGKFDFITPIKGAWNKAWDWLKSNIGPAASAFWDTLVGYFSGLPNPFAGLSLGTFMKTIKDIGDTFGKSFDFVIKILGPALKDLWDVLVKGGKEVVDKLGPVIAQFKDLWQPLQDALKQWWDLTKPLVEIIGGALVVALFALIKVLSVILPPIIDAIVGSIKGFLEILHGVIDFLVGIFTSNMDEVWKGVKEIIKGFVDGVVGGGGLIGTLIQGFKDFIDRVKADWNKLWGDLKDFWNKDVVPFWDSIKNAVADVAKWITDKWNEISNAFQTAWNTVSGYVDGFVNTVNGIKNRIANAWDGMFDGMKGAFRGAVNWIINRWDDLPGFTIGGGSYFGVDIPSYHVGLGYIQPLAKGGMVASQAMAIVGEGRSGYPEYVIPTDPMYRERALGLFMQLAPSLGSSGVLRALMMSGGVAMMARGGTLGSRTGQDIGTGLTLIQENKTTHVHFHGNLEFPNIKGGNDADEFLRNLEALMSEA